MSTPKETFLRDKELAKQWSAVANSDWFGKVLIHARAEMLESRVTTEEMDGARRLVATLLTLADAEAVDVPFPSTGLRHDLEITPKSRKPKE